MERERRLLAAADAEVIGPLDREVATAVALWWRIMAAREQRHLWRGKSVVLVLVFVFVLTVFSREVEPQA
jgi:hypothetical protein